MKFPHIKKILFSHQLSNLNYSRMMAVRKSMGVVLSSGQARVIRKDVFRTVVQSTIKYLCLHSTDSITNNGKISMTMTKLMVKIMLCLNIVLHGGLKQSGTFYINPIYLPVITAHWRLILMKSK